MTDFPHSNGGTLFVFYGATAPGGPRLPRYLGFAIILRHTPHSAELLQTSDQPDAETST
jgi:hypothetical protein